MSSTSHISLIFNAALDSYAGQTGIDLTKHPFTLKLQQCESTDAIIGHFQAYRNGDRKLITVLKTIAEDLFSISSFLGETILVGLHRFRISG
jgi:hypothetical protein